MNVPFPLSNILIDYFNEGGPIMWPILVLLILALAVTLERVLWWFSLRRRVKQRVLNASFDAISAGEFEKAIQLTSHSNDPFLRTLNEGLRHANTSMLGAMQICASDELEGGERMQWVLGTLITLAPLMGLLGTITGIMRSFSFVGDEQLAASKVSGGIAEALIATACGLCIAMFCLIPFNYFNRRISRFRSQLERVINHTELLVASAKHHGHDLEAFAGERALRLARSGELVEEAMETMPDVARV